MIVLTALCLAGLCTGIFVFSRAMDRMLAAEKVKSRSPFKEKLLRPPGESVRLRIDGLFERLLVTCVKLSGCLSAPGIVPALVQGFSKALSWEAQVAVWLTASAAAYGVALRHWRRLKALRAELRNCRLGFDGERYVAEKLTALTAEGWRVYHDFVFDMKAGGDATTFNIDHIAVSTRGVFALETKTWRQPNGPLPPGNRSHEVTASGDTLHLPGGHRTRKPVEQARRNAVDLSAWLTGSAPRPAPVFPVVVMPGWFVRDDGTGAVPVVSGKPVAGMLRRMGAKDALTPDEARALADRIEAHCRNVEGA